jgi:hypothetical protein
MFHKHARRPYRHSCAQNNPSGGIFRSDATARAYAAIKVSSALDKTLSSMDSKFMAQLERIARHG